MPETPTCKITKADWQQVISTVKSKQKTIILQPKESYAPTLIQDLQVLDCPIPIVTLL